MNKTVSRSLFCASSLLLVLAIPLQSQIPAPEVSLAVGAMQFDASGTGTVPVIALRGAIPLASSWILGEGNFSYASLDEQNGVGTRVGVAEGQVQFQLPSYRIRPYMGLGGGWLHYFTNAGTRETTSPTVSVAAGLRARLSGRFGASAELRVRTWRYGGQSAGFGNSAAEWTAGTTYSF